MQLNGKYLKQFTQYKLIREKYFLELFYLNIQRTDMHYVLIYRNNGNAVII